MLSLLAIFQLINFIWKRSAV